MTPRPSWVYVGLGGNLGAEAEILARLDDASERLRRRAADRAQLLRSPVYRTAPVGPVADQPPFLNQVVGFEPAPDLQPRALLELCRAIETAHGRTREVAQGPRTLDVDILLFGERRVSEPDLVIPHPRLGHRAFVLAPLLDLVGAGQAVEKIRP